MSLRRNLFAAALAAVVALPSAALAQRATTTKHRTTTTSTSTAPALSFGGGAGIESGLGDTGLTLRVDGVYPLQNLTPEVTMGIVGTLGLTHYGDEVSSFGASSSYSTNLFKLIPAVRFGYALNPQFSLYGDAGLGLYLAHTSVEVDLGPGFPSESDSSSDIGLMMKFAAGGLYAVSPKLQLGAELGLNPYFGEVGDTSFTLMGVVMYKM